MSNELLNLQNLEPTSALVTVPLNGSPSSADYNSTNSQFLVDISTIFNFLNNTLLPAINALPATAANGLEGETLIGDSSDNTPLFFDSTNNKSLVMADVARYLQGLVISTQTQVTNLNAIVVSLQTLLASTSQNDIAQQIQNFALSLQNIANQINVGEQQINNLNNLVTSIHNPIYQVDLTLSSAQLISLNTTLTLSGASIAANGLTVYTGTITGGATTGGTVNGLGGAYVTITGFSNSGNNVTNAYVMSSTGTTITVVNPNGVTEVTSASAVINGYRLIQSPGTGSGAVLTTIGAVYESGTTPFTIGSSDCYIDVSTFTNIGSSSQTSFKLEATGFLDQSLVQATYTAPNSVAGLLTSFLNNDISVYLVGTTPTLTAGDGGLLIATWYYIL